MGMNQINLSKTWCQKNGIAVLTSKNQESQWSKLMNEGTDTETHHVEQYVTDELAENIKTVYKHVSKQFAQKFE